jgi:uncharacterized membrane protein
LAKEFLNPNWHVALLHYPLGLLLAGVLIELFSFMWRRHAFRAAGRWMILLGALSGIPASTAGIYALADVSRIGLSESEAAGQWKDVAAVSPLWKDAESEPAHLMRDHVWLMSIATVLAVLVCVVWIGSSDGWRSKLHLPLLIVLLIATALTASGAWHSGEAVYRHGVAVELQGTQPVIPPATMPSLAERISPSTTAPSESTAARLQRQFKNNVEYYVPPLQLHVVLAGSAVAIAMAALALALRAISAGPGITQVDHIAQVLGTPESTGIDTAVREERRGLSAGIGGEVPHELIRPRVPAARFWMLTFLLALLTALAGVWVLSRGYETWDPKVLWNAVRERDQSDGQIITRRLGHVAAGGAIVILPLLLAIFARLAPRARFLLILLALLLLAAVAVQIWLGVLLMFDTNVGPVSGFN